MARDLTRINEIARNKRKEKFTSIYHLVSDPEQLRAGYEAIDGRAAPGVDGVTKEEYGQGLESKIVDLSKRLKEMSYRPKPVKRAYVPKPGSDKKRPLGVPCLEDKIVQNSVRAVLEQIYEADFVESSYGYRPGRTQHGALDELGRTIQQKKVSYVVEADIKGFFDHVNQEWLMKFLEERITDQRVLRLIVRILKSGIMEDGLVRASDEGVPQGGSLSPLLSNIYLHYALDLWVERQFKTGCGGEVYYFRYADDYLACFQYQEEAKRFLTEMEERLMKFHLEIEPRKTKLIEFGRFAERDALKCGREPEQFDFLGFTHYCGKTRNGRFKIKRKTSKKKLRAKLREAKEWLRKERSHVKSGELLRRAKQKLQGHLNYYAITDNGRECGRYRHQMQKLLYRWLNRRSQRRSYTWERLNAALTWIKWPRVLIKHNLNPFRRESA